MLIWVCALHCEAKPVIDFYRLKKHRDQTAFDLYSKDEMACVVSGMGRVNSAAATAWVGGLYSLNSVLAWINLGVAGSKTVEVGSAFVINKIVDEISGKAAYPIPLKQKDFTSTSCLTLTKSSTDYPAQGLIDMEASAFFNTATRFSSAELVQSIKVVSDNVNHEPDHNKQRLSTMIQNHQQTISSFANKLELVRQQQQAVSLPNERLQLFLKSAHFTSTQRSQLKKILINLLSQNNNEKQLLELTSQYKKSHQILDCLTQHLQQQSQEL